MEVSVRKCQQMIDDAKAAKRKLGVAYRCQYDPNHLECVRLARAKEFGGIKIIESSFNVQIGDPGQWRLKHALSGFPRPRGTGLTAGPSKPLCEAVPARDGATVPMLS